MPKCQINPIENIHLLLKPTAQNLLDAFNQANYNLQDYQAVTAVAYNKYWEKPNLEKQKKVSFMPRFVLADNFISNQGGEIVNFVHQLLTNWNNVSTSKLQLLVRPKDENLIFSGHWPFLFLTKKENNLNVYIYESLGIPNPHVIGNEDTFYVKRIKKIFSDKFEERVAFYNDSVKCQMDDHNCPTFALDAAFRSETNPPFVDADLIGTSSTKEIQMRNCQNGNEFLRCDKYASYFNKINPGTNESNNFINNGIRYKRQHFKDTTQPFLQFLAQNPKIYEQMLEARKGIQFLTTGFKPNWLFFFVNPYIEPTEMLNYCLWQFKSWAKEWIQSATFYSSNRRNQGNEIIAFVDILNKNRATIMAKIIGDIGKLRFGDKISKYGFCSTILDISVTADGKTKKIQNLLDNTGTAHGFNQKSPKEKLNDFLYELKIADRNAGIPLAFSERITPKGTSNIKNMWC
jgi:hypothetical protein